MKLIVGLGNPGRKYERTRHNIGFMVVDAMASRIQNSKFKTQNDNSKLKINKKLQCYEFRVNNHILAKPVTYMNSSGSAVSKLATYYRLRADDIWVIHDDLDIKLGEYKIQKGVGPKLHYGIESINKALGTKQYWRVRFGVDNRATKFSNKKTNLIKQIVNFSPNLKVFRIGGQFSRRIPGEKYVLQNFTPDEEKVLDKVIDEIVKKLIGLIT